MDIFGILITLIIYGVIFWLLFWLANYIALGEPFNKIIRVALAIGAVIVIIGLLTGHVHTFPILR